MNSPIYYSSRGALEFGVQTFKENMGYCLTFLFSREIVCLVSAISLSVMATAFAQLVTGLEMAPPDTFVYCFLIFYLLVKMLTNVPVTKFFLRLAQGERATIDEILGFDASADVALLFRYTAATVAFSCFCFLFSFLLLLPGLFMASTLRYYRFFVVDKQSDSIDSLRESYEMSGSKKGELVGLFVHTFLMKLMGLLCMFVGFIPAIAITTLAEAYTYQALVAQSHDNAQSS